MLVREEKKSIPWHDLGGVAYGHALGNIDGVVAVELEPVTMRDEGAEAGVMKGREWTPVPEALHGVAWREQPERPCQVR